MTLYAPPTPADTEMHCLHLLGESPTHRTHPLSIPIIVVSSIPLLTLFQPLFLATLIVHIPFIYGTRITPISSVNPCEPFLLIIYHTYCDPIYSDPIHADSMHSDSMHSDPISPLLFSG